MLGQVSAPKVPQCVRPVTSNLTGIASSGILSFSAFNTALMDSASDWRLQARSASKRACSAFNAGTAACFTVSLTAAGVGSW